jgi:hypothetical protein
MRELKVIDEVVIQAALKKAVMLDDDLWEGLSEAQLRRASKLIDVITKDDSCEDDDDVILAALSFAMEDEESWDALDEERKERAEDILSNLENFIEDDTTWLYGGESLDAD